MRTLFGRGEKEKLFGKERKELKMASKKEAGSIVGGPTGKRTSDEGADGAKKQKLCFGISKPSAAKPSGFQIKLNSNKPTTVQPLQKSSVFNNESDDEPEEMPPEAKMRMKNIGRETPTSAGPNSFGKTKQGFTNIKRVYEMSLSGDSSAMDDSKEKKET